MFNQSMRSKIVLGVSMLAFVISFIITAIDMRGQMIGSYTTAIEKFAEGDYQEALDMFNNLGDYRDSLMYEVKAQNNIDYKNAVSLYEQGSYEEAEEIFLGLDDFLDSQDYIEKINNILDEQSINLALYEEANNYYEAGDFEQALKKYKELGDYENSVQLAQSCESILLRLTQSNVISAGIRSSGAIKSDGSVLFSGEDIKEMEVIKGWTDIVSISINGEFVMGLKENGTVVTAHSSSSQYRMDTSSWSDIIAISAGQQYIVGLKSDGTLLAQGHNGDGQAEVDDWTNIIAIATGWRHTVGLGSNGEVHIIGYGSQSQLRQINDHKNEWTDVVAISAGGGSGEYGEGGHTVALRKDRTVVAVGDNNSGQCNVYSDDWTDIIAISAGDFHTVGLKSDGTVVTTLTHGDSYEEIKSWNNIVAVSAGYGFTLGLKSDGTIVSVGFDKNGQRNTDSWENILPRKEWEFIFQDTSINDFK